MRSGRRGKGPQREAPVRVFLCAGDPSGDVHAAMLARAVKRSIPGVWCYGVGGRAMREAEVALLADTTELSAIGVVNALPKIPRALAVCNVVKQSLRHSPPSVVVLVDWPAFNMRILSYAHRLGLPTLYYFPPASWRREPSVAAQRVAALATDVATPFEWSAEIICGLGGRATRVGHPSLDRYADRPSEARARGLLSIPLTAVPVAVLPGSRRQEIIHILPLLLRAAAIARKSQPNLLPIVSCAPSADRALIEAVVARWYPGAPVTEATSTLLPACRAALAKSGTITLDAAVCGLPTVVTYASSWIAELQYRLFMRGRIKYIAAPNILVGREVVPERFGENGTPARLAEELLRLLEDGPERDACLKGLAEAVALLGTPGASERTAKLVADLAARGWAQP